MHGPVVRRLAKFIVLAELDLRLLVQAFATLALAQVLLRMWSIDRLRAWCGRTKSGNRSVDRIAWAVSSASQWTPGASCLPSAMALQRLLSANAHSSELCIGVAKDGQALVAHAWVVCEGEVRIGAHEPATYTPLMAWPVAGPIVKRSAAAADPR